MSSSNQNVHMVWIGDKLNLLEQLTIKLYQSKGLTANLWSYDKIDNVPENTVLRDASEILPKNSLFSFQKNLSGEPGNGSYAQWSDQFQLTLLQKYGEWYSQLDVACLKLPSNPDYYFVHHPGKIVDVCVMKTPKNAPFIKDCLKELSTKLNKTTCKQFDWELSMQIIGSHISNAGLGHCISRNVIENGQATHMVRNTVPPPEIEFIHWWNAACDNYDKKNNPSPNTFYYKLLQDVGLV